MSAQPSDRQVVPTGKFIDDYEVIGLVGVGGFGGIYKVKNKHSGKTFAMKTESTDAARHLLKYEIMILKEIKGKYFPKYFASGTSDKYKVVYLIMSYFGASINDIQSYHDYKLNIEVVYNLCLKMLDAIKAFHKFGFVHRDIKPGNFLITQNSKYPIVLIDYNLSARHIDPDTNKPFPCINEHMFLGTKIFASIDVLKSFSSGYKDDLISWFYTFIFMACGSLPWDNEKDKEKMIIMKKKFKVSDLDIKLPKQFQKIYDYISSLEYQDKPNYSHIKKLFQKGMKEDHIDPERFNWSDFISKHSNMTEYEEEMSKVTIKYINDHKKETVEEKKDQKVNHSPTKAKQNVEKHEPKDHAKKHSKKKNSCLIE